MTESLKHNEIISKIRDIYQTNDVDSQELYLSLVYMVCEVSMNLRYSTSQVLENISIGRGILIKKSVEMRKEI